LAYGLALVLVILELTRVLPRSAYSVGLMLVVGGSLGLLAVRYAVASSAPVRLMARLLLLGIVLAVLPGLLLWVVPNLMDERGQSVYVVYLPTLAFLLLPFFYAYALFKHRLGDLEFRANKVLSLYSYVLLYTSAFALVFALASRWIDFSVETLAFAIMISTVFVALAVPLRTPYQRLVNRLVYGTEYSSDSILKAFANEIPRANNLTALTRLLTKEVAPSLLVRQSALYQVRDGEPKLLYAEGAPAPEGIDAAEALVRFSAGPARYRPPEPKGGGEWDWVRLAVPIQVGTTPVAVWLFGARDPDDFYPLPDIELLQTLGGQVGVALENLRLVESLRKRAYELEVAYQNLEQLDRLKDEFVQNVSHELRTPLTFVKGYSELMLDGAFGELSRVQNEAVEAIADRTQGIIRLVNDIISVQQAKLLQPEREPIQLEALAATALQTAQVVAGRVASEGRTYRFELEAPTDLPMISGDRRRLGQVLDNLLENAIKFTPSGGTITLGLRPTTYAFPAQECEGEPIHAVEITVKDSGIGIPDDQLARIWDRFYQVDGSRTRRYGGMGLGLAIVRSIVEAHGGVTWASSANGQGTTFHVVLPAVAERPEARVLVVAEGVV
jgi:signal transduction histidine kinase